MKSIRSLISNKAVPTRLCDNCGSVMIAVVIAIVMASILGSYSVYLISSSSDTQVGAHFSLRAYYIAESGQNYVKHLVNNACNSNGDYDPTCCQTQAANLNNITYTMSNGDKFTITGAAYNSGTKLFSFNSTGITNQNTSAEASHTINYFLTLPHSENLTDDTGNWTNIGGSFSSNTDGSGGLVVSPSTGNAKRALLVLDPGRVPLADGNGLLSYDVQVKCMTPASNSEYLMGISFRMRNSAGTYSYYGASFMQSNGHGSKLPNAFNSLEDGHLYIVLWTTPDMGNTATILGYRQVLSTDSDSVISGLLNGTDLRDWSTLVVRVTDSIEDGVRQNTISVYAQNTANYPRGTLNWNLGAPSGFTTVTWTGGAKAGLSSVQDNTLTSNQSNAELGLHMNVHDNGATSKAYFDDFAVKSSGSVNGGGGDIIQF